MKILKIENGKAEFTTNETTYKPITDIGKDDIYSLLKTIYNSQTIEIDSPEEYAINNPAEKIIYVSLAERFERFKSEKSKIRARINAPFTDVISEYNINLDDQP